MLENEEREVGLIILLGFNTQKDILILNLTSDSRTPRRRGADRSIMVKSRQRQRKLSDQVAAPSVPTAPPRSTGLAAASCMMLASGAAALVYQVIWVRQLSLVVGIDVFAITLAISSFFAGLAVGSFLFGRYAERVLQPLRLYVLLELSIALTGVSSTWLLARTPPLFASLEQTSGVIAWSLPCLLVGIPATLMGGTLPVLVKAFVCAEIPLSVQAGRLYGANTLGAIAGTLLGAYVLIPSLGLFDAAVAAATLNAMSAGLASVYRRDSQAASGEPPVVDSASPSTQTSARWGLLLYGIAGGIALGYEVVWSQTVILWTSTRSFAFATVLAVYLAGLAIGSRLASWRSRSVGDPWGRFGVLISGAGMFALLQMLTLGAWLDQWQVHLATTAYSLSGSEQFVMFSRFLLAAGYVLFIPAVLLGAAFPFALQLAEDRANPARSSGQILAANTTGGIAGTLVVGFLLVPFWGIERSLAVLAIGAAVVGFVACWRAPPRSRAIVGMISLITVIAASQINPDQLGKLLAMRRNGELVYHASGAGGTVAVIEQGRADRKFRRLYIQGVSNSGDSMTSMRYMRLQALLPLIIHAGEPKSALVIGLGTGITAGSLLNYEGLERRVCAELVPEVVTAATYFSGNEDATRDPRLEIRRVDGRHELLRQPDNYDLITLEPPPPSASGVANLYSTEFYQLAISRLAPQGIVAQWLPLPTQSDPDTRSLVRSFLDACPYASLWSTEVHEMLLIGSPDPLTLDARKIQARFDQPRVRDRLTQVGISSPAALLATYVCDRSGLEKYSRNSPPVTDDRPRIEYGPWTVASDFPRMFRNLATYRSDCPVINADENLRTALFKESATLNQFYAASLAAYEGDHESWEQSMQQALTADPGNPYYRWFGSEK